MTPSPHPFARFIQILGRGKSLTRALTMAEAKEAMGLIVAGDVLPEQLGAFLMLLRVKEESPEEIAGFVQAAREAMALPSPLPKVDLDWSSYAGKRRQLPWFILAALLLARNGMRVFMHGGEGHTAGRVYTSEALARLGIPVAGSFEEAAAHLGQRNFAYMTLDQCQPAAWPPTSICAQFSACARPCTRSRACSIRSRRRRCCKPSSTPATWTFTRRRRSCSASRIWPYSVARAARSSGARTSLARC